MGKDGKPGLGGAFRRMAATIRERASTPAPHQPPRPEFSDFDLLATAPAGAALRDRPLWELDFVVFDTETTGLRPSDGDRIVQIGAVHLSAGELVMDRIFDQLVNPGRKIPKRSTRIHGITEAMVTDAPPVAAAVADFHDFAGDAILVAHNAAFDLKFLSLAQGEAGVTFTQPALDTLFLARALDDHAGRKAAHDLDTLIDRYDIKMEDRHSGLADAFGTAHLFLRLIEQLGTIGIHTMGQAIDETRMAMRIRQMGVHF